MKIRYNIVIGSYQLSRLEIVLSKEAQVRLSWFDYYRNHQYNARLTCRHFGISPQTFYRWQKRYDYHHRKTLETRSCHPKRVRQPTYQGVEKGKMRENHPKFVPSQHPFLIQNKVFQHPAILWHRLKPYVRYGNVIPTEAKTNWQ